MRDSRRLADEAKHRRDASRLEALSDSERQLYYLAEAFVERSRELRGEIGRVIVGQQAVVEQLIVALLAGGHVLLEGVPGLAKTLLVDTLGRTLSLGSGRIQFTPDLMPSDVTGTQVIVSDAATQTRSFKFQKGPVFSNLLLADEINRTPPKTQAALLEAMAEQRVTVAGQAHSLPSPFFVMATQNPIEQEGTYSLPEAQLDRFLFKITVDYPSGDEEFRIMKRTTGTVESEPAPVLEREEILGLQRVVRSLPCSTHVLEFATRLVRSSRPEEEAAPDWVRRCIAWGAGPRASQSLVIAGKARALLLGRFAVTREDIRAVALPVLRHRLLPTFPAEAEGLSVDDLVSRLLVDTPSFPDKADYDEPTRRILRY